MGEQADWLASLVTAPDPFATSAGNLRPIQLAAINERLAERTAQIGALRHRCAELGVTSIDTLSDLVPLLFTFNTYRSYPAMLVDTRRWPMLVRWLQSISAVPFDAAPDLEGVDDVDQWLDRMRAAGHYIQTAPGADGKVGFIDQTSDDYRRRTLIPMVEWAAGRKAARDMPAFVLAPRHGANVFIRSFTLLAEAFGRPDAIHFLSDEPLRVVETMRLGALSKAFATGSADQADIRAALVAQQERGAQTRADFDRLAEEMLRHRGEAVMIYGLANQHLALVEALDRIDAPDGLFAASSVIGPALKPGPQMNQEDIERIHRRYGTEPSRAVASYAMSEVTSAMPMCAAGRYHVLPWQPVLLLDRDGEQALEPIGVVEGRAALFDLLVEGRWGAVLTGDKITVDFAETCPCGRSGPTILDSIARYSDLDDDKLSCAGSIDAYVKGVIS